MSTETVKFAGYDANCFRGEMVDRYIFQGSENATGIARYLSLNVQEDGKDIIVFANANSANHVSMHVIGASVYLDWKSGESVMRVAHENLDVRNRAISKLESFSS